MIGSWFLITLDGNAASDVADWQTCVLAPPPSPLLMAWNHGTAPHLLTQVTPVFRSEQLCL